MATKPKVKTFSIGYTVTLELELPIQAENFEKALEIGKTKKLADLLKVHPNVSHNDDTFRVRQVSTGEWLNGQ